MSEASDRPDAGLPGTEGGAGRADASGATPQPRHSSEPDGPDGDSVARRRKFRQAAFVYLHVGILYEAGVWVLWQRGVIGDERGPVELYLFLGAVILGAIFWGLWSWRNRWFARAVWAVHALRVPALLEGSFLPVPDSSLPPSFYLGALAVVLINLWMLARAGWDL